MGRISTIKMLPRAGQAQISNLHRAGYTNQQITQYLRELGGNTVSKSTVQRWAKDLNRVGKRQRLSPRLASPRPAPARIQPQPSQFGGEPQGCSAPPRFALRHCKKEVALLPP